MKEKVQKFFSNTCFIVVGLGIFVSLMQLMEWVDPWWSTGYNKSLIWDQIAALAFWAIMTTFLSMPMMVREGLFFFESDTRKNMLGEIKQFLPTGRLWVALSMGAMFGGMYMLIVLIDSSAELATGMATVVTILAAGFILTVQACPWFTCGFSKE